MEALKRYRSGVEQKVTLQHVSVAEGGHAIVGNVSGRPCKSPSVLGKKRCRMQGALGSGAPRGNKNALKHGRFTREAIAERGHIRELVRQARELLLQIE